MVSFSWAGEKPWVSIKLLKASLTSEVLDHLIQDVHMSIEGEVTLLEVIAKNSLALQERCQGLYPTYFYHVVFKITDDRFGSSSYTKLLNFLPSWF